MISGVPEEKWTNESGWVDLWAPPRGYAVYVPSARRGGGLFQWRTELSDAYMRRDAAHRQGSRSCPSIVRPLTGKIATLPGIKAVAKVAFPPLISFVQVTDLLLRRLPGVV